MLHQIQYEEYYFKFWEILRVGGGDCCMEKFIDGLLCSTQFNIIINDTSACLLKAILIWYAVGVISPFDMISGLSAPPSRLVKDEYGNEIGMNMSNSEEVSQTVQHPPQNEFARILTTGGMGVFTCRRFVML